MYPTYFIKAIALLCIFALTACDSADPAPSIQQLVGPAQNLGNGQVYSIVEVDDGVPTMVGLVIDESALAGLPEEGHHEVVVALPSEASVPPFDHLTIDWNPHGHEPPGVYDLPHFDVHLYMISAAERDAIDPAMGDAFMEAAGRQPDGKYVPAGYVPTPGAVPRMGAHWIDPQSPEFSEAGFSRTFIYGFWDGQMNFLEPMVTTSFLESVKTLPDQAVRHAVPQPAAYQKAGYYPTHYRISYEPDDQAYRVILEGLVRKDAS